MMFRLFRPGLLNAFVLIIGVYQGLGLLLSEGVITEGDHTKLSFLLLAYTARVALLLVTDTIPNMLAKKAYDSIK